MIKKNLLLFIILSIMCNVVAVAQQPEMTYPSNSKEKRYDVIIYTDKTLGDKVNEESKKQNTRASFGSDLLNSFIGAGTGLATGYVTSTIDFGINAVGNLLTRKKRLRQEWEDEVAAESNWSVNMQSVEEIKDFYNKTSTEGALDPKDMCFDGIGCLRKEGNDTVFFMSCHLDRTKLDRLFKHSKFQLTLDTLIISTKQCNLPNTKLPIVFNFDERKNFNLSIDMVLSSSWFTDAIELHRDEELGRFNLNVNLEKDDVDTCGYFRYVRPENQISEYAITGESFIVPRSYMGYRDDENNFNNIWGTGQYKLNITLKESCGISELYKNHWNEDRKKRNKLKHNNKDFLNTVWETVTTQKWDELTRSWVITTLTAPAGVLTNEMKKKLGVSGAKANASNAQSQASSGLSNNAIPNNKPNNNPLP